jgi:hypothetical protein
MDQGHERVLFGEAPALSPALVEWLPPPAYLRGKCSGLREIAVRDGERLSAVLYRNRGNAEHTAELEGSHFTDTIAG